MRTYLFVLIITWIATSVCSQVNDCANARYIALSGAVVAVPGVHVFAGNPATLPSGNASFTAAVLNPYLVKNLVISSVRWDIPFQKSAISSGVNYISFRTYHQLMGLLGYGMQLGANSSAGVCFSIRRQGMGISDAGTYSLSGKLGWLMQVKPGFTVGASASRMEMNIHRNSDSGRFDHEASMGISWKNSRVLVATEFRYHNKDGLQAAFACELSATGGVRILGGTRFGRRSSYSFGTGYTFSKVNITIAMDCHTILGLSGAVSIRYFLRNTYEK